MMQVKAFENETYAVKHPEGDLLLVAYDEAAVYGVEVAFPESDEEQYRVDLVRTTRDQHGAELAQRLPLAEFPSQMEAEARLEQTTSALWEQGHEALPGAFDSIRQERTGFTAGYLPVTYPPDGELTEEPVALALMGVHENGSVQTITLGQDISARQAGQMITSLEYTQSMRGTSAMLDAAQQQAVALGTLAEGQPLITPEPHTPMWYLDHREALEPELDPLLAEATRLGAIITDLEKETQGMNNTLKADRYWDVELNEHVTYLPPHVTAEYRRPLMAEGEDAVRLRPAGDPSMYGFEVSAPDEQGDVTLAAIKTFQSDILQKNVTEAAVLKTYHAADYDESVSYRDPRSEALSDARALVYEWGRHDLDHAMGSALLHAQDNGFKGDTLFEQGPSETFTLPDDARPVAAIHADLEWEHDAEHFGVRGYRVPLPENGVYAHEVGRYGMERSVPPGLFYGVVVREETLEGSEQPLYVVDGMKAWLDRDTREPESETVTLDVLNDRKSAIEIANGVVQQDSVPERLEQMEVLAHDLAQRSFALTDIPLSTTGRTPAEELGLNIRGEGLFRQGPELDLSEPPMLPPIFVNPYVPPDLNYNRTIGEAAYDLPLEEGQAYGFRMRPIPELEEKVAQYGVDALAVEAVKSWQEDGQPQQEVVTLGIYHDRDDARKEVNTYVELAETEGIQIAMSRAAMLADVHHSPDMAEQAQEYDLHINPNIRYGDLFSRGPADPFLSESDIRLAEKDFEDANPAHHRLSLEVVPIHDPAEQHLGHAVMAVDARWDHEETSRDLEDAQAVSAYELAHFVQKSDAEEYALSLNDYMGKREIAAEGTDLTAAENFVKTVSQVNGFGAHERLLNTEEVGNLAQGTWEIQHETADFQPMPLPQSEHNVSLEMEL